MDNIKQDTINSINKKEGLIKDILKYKTIINNNNIKAFIEKYVTKADKLINIKKPTTN